MTDLEFLAQYRMREALREAERERLVRLAERNAATQLWYAPFLLRIGVSLAALGAALQDRFAQPATWPAPAIHLRPASSGTHRS